MKRILALVFAVVTMATVVAAQRAKPPESSELGEITRRGRMLAEYDTAAWHSTDAVMALSPREGTVDGYLGRKKGDLWTVVYGRISEKGDKYLIAYETVQQGSPKQFKVTTFEKPKEDAGFFLTAAKALALAKKTFVPAERRPYNAAVLPDADGNMYVYLMPAQTETGIFPLGGDVRYKVSEDGRIIETRQLHKSIIEFQVPDGIKGETGYHTAILDDAPEDTDVFHVLARDPKLPELVVTPKFVYRIAVDGTISYLMATEAFKKIGKN